MERLTKEQAAIIGVYTGIVCGPFADVHEKIEQIMGRPVFTHEMGDESFVAQVREKAKDEFLSICCISDEDAQAQSSCTPNEEG